MLHLPLRFSFKSTWKSISPFLIQMCMIVWGNTLLLQWPQLCWWLLTLTAPMAPVASAAVVWPQILTEATRGKKDLGAACCLVKWCQSTLFLCFLDASGVAPQGGWACLIHVLNIREVFPHLGYFSIPEIKIKERADAISPLSPHLPALNGLCTSCYINQIIVETWMWTLLLLLVFSLMKTQAGESASA